MIYCSPITYDLKEYKKMFHDALDESLESGYVIGGKVLEDFEKNLSEFLRTPNQVAGVANGTEAIALLLMAHKIGVFFNGKYMEDEVIVPSISAYPTSTGVIQAGARPVYCPVDTKTGLLDTKKVFDYVNPKTKAVIVVSLYGNSLSSKDWQDLRKKLPASVALIEDSAQSLGTKIGNQISGGLTETSGATFSFYPTKNIGALGDGGAIRFKDVSTLKALRDYGQSKRYHHDTLGFNSRLDTLQAKILDKRLELLPKQTARRQEIASYYLNHIKNIEFLETPKDVSHSYHLFVMKSKKRDQLIKHLAENKIHSDVHYPIPMPLQKYSSKFINTSTNYEACQKFCDEVISIPCHHHLSDQDVNYVTEKINNS